MQRRAGLATTALAAFMACAWIAPAHADVVFQDAFSSNANVIDTVGRTGGDPTRSAAWTVTAATGVTIASNGTFLDFTRTATGSTATSTLVRTIDATQYTNLAVSLRYTALNTDYETQDFIRLEVDTGTGFITKYNRGDDPEFEQPAIGTVGPFAITGGDQEVITLRLSINFNAGVEGYRLDTLTVTGDLVPEPASALLLLPALSLFSRRRPRA